MPSTGSGPEPRAERGAILLADDEPAFLDTTADLLRRAAFACDTATSAHEARSRVTERPYDLLISDLEMPGNRDLALVRDVAALGGGLPVIIVTGYPSTQSAIASIDLPVTAYLVKPVEFRQLLERVERAIARHRAWQAVRRAEAELARWREELAPAADDTRAAGVEAFLSLALHNVMGGLADLERMSRALASGSAAPHACQVLNCPRGSELRAALRHVIMVLEETKSSFKSRRLAELRQQLELLLETA
ncbi:MAG TPA: response regulator [Gemmatimonadaceae bacterium]